MADKVAITVEEGLLQQVEALRRRTKESRSAVFARGARMLLNAEENRRKIDRYRDAYREYPETDDELARAEALAKVSVTAVKWDE
jgi:metal-responsive CopG/Arc/MetJ family transcriptional regulator